MASNTTTFSTVIPLTSPFLSTETARGKWTTYLRIGNGMKTSGISQVVVRQQCILYGHNTQPDFTLVVHTPFSVGVNWAVLRTLSLEVEYRAMQVCYVQLNI